MVRAGQVEQFRFGSRNTVRTRSDHLVSDLLETSSFGGAVKYQSSIFGQPRGLQVQRGLFKDLGHVK